MKKKSLFVTALFGMIVLFSSCEKEITSTALIVDETKTAVLKLYVKADLDTSIVLENVPDGTQFNVSVLKSDLNSGFTGNGRWSTTATTSGGIMQIDVPTKDAGVTVYVDGVAFEYSYTTVNDTIENRKYEYNGAFNGILPASNNIFTITMIPTAL